MINFNLSGGGQPVFFCRSTLRCSAASRSTTSASSPSLLLLRRLERLAALEFGLDQLLQLLAVLVGVVLGVEVVGEAVDQHRGHLQLGRLDADRILERGELGRADLVGPEQGLDHQHLVADPQRGQPGLLPEGEVDDGDPVGLLQGLPQQHVRLGRGRRGLQVVGLVEQHRVDLIGRDEADDVDLPAGAGRQLGEVLVGEHDGAPVVALVGLGDVGVGHLLAIDVADPLVPDPPAVLGVDLVEPDVLLLGGGVQLDGHVHQSERHGAFPDRSHVPMMNPSAMGSQGGLDG